MKARSAREFRNVDLEILARSKLDAIEAGMSGKAHALFSGRVRKGLYLLALECNVYPEGADAAILELCEAVEELGHSERQLWERASQRTFDVGYGMTAGSRTVHVALNPETLRRVAALGATIAFTCYPKERKMAEPLANAKERSRRRAGEKSPAAGIRRRPPR